MTENPVRKVRKSNFSTDEVDVLVDSVRANYGVLYGKDAKRATNRWVRQEAWLDILGKVNGVSIEKRTLQEVKNKWKKCQYALKEKGQGAIGDDAGDSPWEDFVDSMPLQERLSKMAAQERIAGQVLKSQPLSPTKLKVTRQGPRIVKPPEPPQSPVNEEMCLRWNSHHSNMQTAFPSILSKEQYVDVTLAAEGKTLKCHRLILSSCSPYFEEILSGISPFQHPVLFMKDIPFWILKSLCDFMYAGEVHIFQNKLEELLTVAEALKIKGLAGKSTPPDPQSENKETKKKNSQGKHHTPPVRKHPIYNQNSFESTSQDYDDDLLDPLDLLEPLYEEAAEEKKPAVTKPKENKYQYQPVKKPFGRRLRKRKYSEQQNREPSPPPVFSFRKGTRSRPNVKIPKYYHPEYTNPPKPALNSQTDPLLDVDEIKTEPIDVEDNLIDYSDEDHYLENSLETTNCDSPIIITSTKPNLPDKFKKIKLTKPIITEVHSIEEPNPPSGGLEVIKITVQQPEESGKETEEVTPEPEPEALIIRTEPEPEEAIEQTEPEPEEPLQGVVIACTEGGVEETEKMTVENESIDGHVTENGAGEEEEEEVEKQDGDIVVPVQNIQIENVRSESMEQDQEVNLQEEEERRTASLNHLEKEAMSVADAITMESQTDPPDIEEKV
ncbi:uncharacterized protein LOC123009313 isoform X2 [Tribolium madens]|uniref:uncharacterized protein LOC123009313 isoform X2 n=1 Tax=Tribolium madens TaxID=41895 RepID=UPI001CF75F25|nr:uncharacterized protein LOC123009313 isoform X2 [Tribolium madens]